MRPFLRLSLLLLALLAALPSTVLAQYGPVWTWDARVGASQRANQNRVDDAQIGRFSQNDLTLDGGVNGFIVHPALAVFRASGTVALGAFGAGSAGGRTTWGLRGDLNLFPRGHYPIQLFAARTSFDYEQLTEEDPVTLRGRPESSTSFGGRVRVRTGALRGLSAGLSRNVVALQADDRDDISQTEFVDWSRAGRLRQRVRLEHRLRDFGAADVRRNQYTFRYDHHGDMGAFWRWNLAAIGNHNDVAAADLQNGHQTSFRLSSQVHRPLRGQDSIQLRYGLGIQSGATQDTRQSHAIAAAYRWQPATRWMLSSSATLGFDQLADVDRRSTQLGLAANWSGPWRTIAFQAGGAVSHARQRPSSGATQSSLGASFSTTVAHGRQSGLSKELELALSLNRLRLGDEAIDDLPGLDLVAVDSLEDLLRLRFTLGTRWRTLRLHGRGQWDHAIRGDERTRVTGDVLSATAQLDGRSFGLSANVGETKTEGDVQETVRFVGGRASYRPTSAVELYGSYRHDTRILLLSPDVDADRFEVGVLARFGLFDFDARVFQFDESLASATRRTNRGYRWSIARRFGGLLPFTRLQLRRGTVR